MSFVNLIFHLVYGILKSLSNCWLKAVPHGFMLCLKEKMDRQEKKTIFRVLLISLEYKKDVMRNYSKMVV